MKHVLVLNHYIIELVNSAGQHIKLGIVDIDELNLDFSKVPVFVAYVKGEEVNNMLGSDPQGLKDFIKNTILLK